MKFIIYDAKNQRIATAKNAKKARAIVQQNADFWAVSCHKFACDMVLLVSGGGCRKYGYKAKTIKASNI